MDKFHKKIPNPNRIREVKGDSNELTNRSKDKDKDSGQRTADSGDEQNETVKEIRRKGSEAHDDFPEGRKESEEKGREISHSVTLNYQITPTNPPPRSSDSRESGSLGHLGLISISSESGFLVGT